MSTSEEGPEVNPPADGVLDRIRGPRDLRRLTRPELDVLAGEIRDFLVEKVARTGGHLGPNLGVVELTLALHRVFDSPKDRVLFDTGHQAYVHKIVTGRQEGFDQLRQRGGLTGYPNQAESEHDVIENCHASTALSYADGMAKAFALRGEKRHVVAVVGDGALTGGMCWEALNNIAAAKKNPLVIVVNDNGRSYAPTIGGLADHLGTLRLNPGYEKVLDLVKDSLAKTPWSAARCTRCCTRSRRASRTRSRRRRCSKTSASSTSARSTGTTCRRWRARCAGPRATAGRSSCTPSPARGTATSPRGRRGRLPAQPVGLRPGDRPPDRPASLKWTSVFGDELLALADERPDVVGITAAMGDSTGISKLAAKYPDRAFDVGIAEQHATTSAAGLALGGMHPVVAIYATFLNRAFDQVLLDVAMHRLPVTFVLDRAGITGPDGPSHYGIWDLAVFGVVPGLRIAAPRDAATLRAELREAVAIEDGPTIVRFPTGSVPADLPAVRTVGGVDVLTEGERRDVLLVSVGSFAGLGVEVAGRLAEHGYGVTVVDPRWVRPVPVELVGLAADHRLVVVVEDGIRAGGVGGAVAQRLRDAGVGTPVHEIGVEPGWYPHGTRNELLSDLGLTAQDVARQVTGWITNLDAATEVVASL
jgi:1-deoxy-D-xylulose-5-phosphate synthase